PYTTLFRSARMDGASEWQVYRLVIFPQLTPVLMSAVVIIAHMSLKSFDLIMSISSASAYQTKVPAVDMFVFKSGFDYANSAAVSDVLLINIAFLIVPYYVQQHRSHPSSSPTPPPPLSTCRPPPPPHLPRPAADCPGSTPCAWTSSSSASLLC